MSFRNVLYILLPAALVAGTYAYYRSIANENSSALLERSRANMLSLRGDWIKVKRGIFEIAVQEEGELRPVKVTSLNFLSPGKIGFMVPEGMSVAKGDRVISLETKDLEEDAQHKQEDLAVAELALAQQEQLIELEKKRLATELSSEEDKAAFARLKEREILSHPSEVEKEEARNLLNGAEARFKSSETDLLVTKPLVEKGFASQQDLELKQVAFEKAKIEQDRAAMKARIIRDGALPDERKKAALDQEFAKLGLKVKAIDNEDKLDLLKTNLDGAARLVKIARNKLDKINEELARSTIRAPHDGVVVYRPLSYKSNKKPEVGERVSPYIATVELPNYEKMKVRTQVPESLISKIHARGPQAADGSQSEPGSSARIMIKTIPGIVYQGQVIWIDGWARDRNSKLSDADIKAQGMSGVKVFDVEVELDESDPQRLREGFRATVDFPEETLKNVVAIPIEAVSTLDGISSVIVQELGFPEIVKVELGRASMGKVEIKSGLKEGMKIFVPKPPQAEPDESKSKIKPADKKKPAKKTAAKPLQTKTDQSEIQFHQQKGAQ